MGVELSSYLQTLGRQLRLEHGQEREIVRELQGHLEDKIAELEAQGIDREAAYRLALQDMGQPGEVARGMHEVHSPALWPDILLATVPHFLLAALFALHLWSHYFLVGLLLIVISLVTWRNWRAGNPSKWSYSWLGYTLAAPALSWLLALVTLGYGAWTLLTTGQLPFNVVFFILLIGYVPFSMWIMASVIYKVVRQDWLLASFTALPFPFLTSWVLFLNWQGGLWANHSERIQESDSARAFIFLAMAVTTIVFLRMGPRLVKVSLLTLSTTALVVISVASLPIGFSLLGVVLIILASIVFLFSPAMLESRISYRQSRYHPSETPDEVVTHWFTNAT